MATKAQKNVDIERVLSTVVEKEMRAYKDDFQVDVTMLRRTKQRNEPMLWLCRPLGTHLLNVNQMCIKGTREYNTVMYFASQKDSPIAASYLILPKCLEDGRIFGDLKKVDFEKEVQVLKKESVNPKYIQVKMKDENQKAKTEMVSVTEDSLERELGKYLRNCDVEDFSIVGEEGWKETVLWYKQRLEV